ncbi:hypothetical protein SLS62_001813 [Diatrype stigma]|uniref:DUF8035 domain-containing protein n=1 Tax=Diatrype stigma TaxID=117547 RepID=A0AAN9V1A6_9PEZI
MTANNTNGVSAPHASTSTIDGVDAFALRLYRRARNSGTDFEDIAFVVRNLHTVLRHLKSEAESPESLLAVGDSAVYTRQLTPIIEDCEFTLQQLNTILDKYGDHPGGNDGRVSPTKHRTRMDGNMGWTMENVEREKIKLIKTKLIKQKLNIDMFLDTIQLHNRPRSQSRVDTSGVDLESIKDKVDAIATRICSRRNSGLTQDEEELWMRFRNELEREGFSREVLRKNQDVLRAYIRQLDERAIANGGTTPSVRGFLEGESPIHDSASQVAPYQSQASGGLDRRASYPDIDTEKYFPSARLERLQSSGYGPASKGVPKESTNMSYESRSSDDDAYTSSDSMALMSTRDIMALDKRSADRAIAMDNMHLQSIPHGLSHAIAESPPSTRYLPPSASQPALLSSSPPTSLDHFGAAPRHVPSLPPPVYGNGLSSPIHSNSMSTPNLMNQQSAAPGQTAPPRRPSLLAPDSQGYEIPLDAKWTRIRRSLVSPEVLAQAGVRYEARPEFVAVLGTLTRNEVVEFARRSAEVRNRRNSAPTGAGTRKERRPEDRYHPDKYRNWDVDTTSNRNSSSAGYVINNTNGRRHSQISTSSSLVDHSSDEVSDSDTDGHSDDEHVRKQPPLSNQARRRSTPYHHSSGNHRYEDLQQSRVRGDSGVSNVSISGSSVDEDERGTKTYPYIVPPPAKENPKESTTSPSATSKPKPILKNKNDDPHVRFDPEPHVLDEGKSPPRGTSRRRGSERDKSRERHRDRDRSRDRDRDRSRDRDRDTKEKKYYSDRYTERDHRYAERDRKERDRYERERERERERDRERKYHHSASSSTPRRDEGSRSSARKRNSTNTSDALKAIGIGGAAASLLSVLTEAASGL